MYLCGAEKIQNIKLRKNAEKFSVKLQCFDFTKQPKNFHAKNCQIVKVGFFGFSSFQFDKLFEILILRIYLRF